MKKLLVVIIVLLASITLSNDAKAECPTWGGWNGPSTTSIVLSPTCRMEIEYCWRLDGTDRDVYFGEVRLIGDCDWYQIDFDNNPSKYFQAAWENIAFIEDPWQVSNEIPMCPEQSSRYYKSGKSACYTEKWIIIWIPDDPHTGVLGHFERIKKPCSLIKEFSCWKYYTACWYYDKTTGTYKVKNTLFNSEIPSLKCSDGCHGVCE